MSEPRTRELIRTTLIVGANVLAGAGLTNRFLLKSSYWHLATGGAATCTWRKGTAAADPILRTVVLGGLGQPSSQVFEEYVVFMENTGHRVDVTGGTVFLVMAGVRFTVP